MRPSYSSDGTGREVPETSPFYNNATDLITSLRTTPWDGAGVHDVLTLSGPGKSRHRRLGVRNGVFIQVSQ